MEIKLSPAMLASIDEHIQRTRGARSILDVYKTAEIVRLEHIIDNIAREDIIEQLVLRAGSNFVLEFNMPEFECDDSLEFIDGSNVEFLLPLDSLNTAH
jgi:hypothetical protein